MSYKLSCGTKLSELSELSDVRAGETNALAPKKIERLEKHVKTCPECRSALHYLHQVSAHTQNAQQARIDVEAADTSWLQNLLKSLVLDTRQGRTIPLLTDYDNGELDQSEGAIRALIRSYASTPEVLVVSTKLFGDVTTVGGACEIDVHIHLAINRQILEVAQQTRDRVWDLISKHTDLNLQAVNIFVDDLADMEEIQEIRNARIQQTA